ncbi:NADPH-dependent FMN reductase [Malonomonas rubra DSM 5091]|uniref:NADPH-dependent FMN reductase n=1 Tax=Malonomonas rubra DSM 5091 TaxID=1122189 RepID=A0A1M6IJ28_MALRU|nr:flavodoxin family protein [Malonomonas rubra]SHJ34383.1 NADPH-dependent FMN reductase [Malonomonas rubra DSM 5091]
MKIICLFASPRKQGNSTKLAKHFLDHAIAAGATVESYYLNDMQMRGCQACDACKKSKDYCVVGDDLQPVLKSVETADLLVFATPVYYGDVSAQLKPFIDRCYSFLKPGYIALDQPNRLLRPIPLLFILAQGHRDENAFADIIPRYQEIFGWTGFADVIPMRVIDVYHLGDAEKKKPDVFAQLEQMAKEMVNRQM